MMYWESALCYLVSVNSLSAVVPPPSSSWWSVLCQPPLWRPGCGAFRLETGSRWRLQGSGLQADPTLVWTPGVCKSRSLSRPPVSSLSSRWLSAFCPPAWQTAPLEKSLECPGSGQSSVHLCPAGSSLVAGSHCSGKAPSPPGSCLEICPSAPDCCAAPAGSSATDPAGRTEVWPLATDCVQVRRRTWMDWDQSEDLESTAFSEFQVLSLFVGRWKLVELSFLFCVSFCLSSDSVPALYSDRRRGGEFRKFLVCYHICPLDGGTWPGSLASLPIYLLKKKTVCKS